MSDLSSSGGLRGRELAQQMRRQQALRKQGGQQGRPAVRKDVPKTKPMASAVTPGPVKAEGQVAKPRGREAALAYRAARCAGAQCWSDPGQRQAPGRSPSTPPAKAPETRTAPPLVPGVEEEFLDSVCEIAETHPEVFGGRDGSVRTLCKARRRSLANRGKVALNVMRGLSSAAARLRYLETGNTHEFARLHREELAKHGRGSAKPARPTGQQRSRKFRAPQKVEISTTAAGGTVSGTLVDRNHAVTGVEAGSCRSITGTEYTGAEHYSRFCGTRATPNPAKVGVGSTAKHVAVTGTQVGRAGGVTGDEAGACRGVTGTEYLSLENFQSFCKTEAPARPDKVAVGLTERRQVPVSGSDEARLGRATGAEIGAAQKITGSQYSDGGAARMTINGVPKKVAETHTFRGTGVTGTAADASSRITGLEAGACRTVTGIEYLSQETFRATCRTEAEPTRPAKVEETDTRKGQRITGNLVERSEKVTGNEPGSCQRVTGAGYVAPRLCGGGTDKVQTMTNLNGSVVTGTGMDRLPKTTGDERGGCLPVTGIDYYGREHYAQCDSVPQAEASKVALTRTGRGQLVSGPALGPAPDVTGNEAGAHVAVSGTPYAGEELHFSQAAARSARDKVPAAGGDCAACGCKARVQELEAQLEKMQGQPSSAGAVASRRYVSPRPAAAVASPAVPEDFSIIPPSRQGRSQVTGNAEMGRRITGPVDLARGLVTGTPEFRSRDASAVSVPESAPPAVQSEGQQEPPAPGAHQITGDDWSRSQQVTGTEGHWAQGRNPTQRGVARTCTMSAAKNKDQPLAVPVPDGKVTGSSGNTRSGSLVTYSGGARG